MVIKFTSLFAHENAFRLSEYCTNLEIVCFSASFVMISIVNNCIILSILVLSEHIFVCEWLITINGQNLLLCTCTVG